jgi:hypothetical protein
MSQPALFCMAGVTFSIPILAVLMIPNLTGSMVALLVFCDVRDDHSALQRIPPVA